MPSFHSKNPYTQLPPRPSLNSGEESLKQLLDGNRNNSLPPSTAAIRLIWDQIILKPYTIKWTVELAKGLARLVLILLEPLIASSPQQNQVERIPDGTLETFSLLASAMEEWSGEVMYEVLLEEISLEKENCPKNVLEILLFFAISSTNDHSVHHIAIVALGTAYRSMDRLHQLLTLDPYRPDSTSWWLKSLLDEEKSLYTLTSVATKILLTSNDWRPTSSELEVSSIFPTLEQVQLGAMSCLSTILKRDQMSSLEIVMEEDVVGELCDLLLRRLQALINPALEPNHSRWHLPCALTSVMLLSLIHVRHEIDMSEFDRIVHSTTLVDNVTNFAFSSSTANNHQTNEPTRWTYEDANAGTRMYGLDVLSSWALSGVAAWSVFIKNESNWKNCVETFWNDVVTHQTQNLAPQITQVVWLQHCCRLVSRGALSSIVQRVSFMDEGSNKISSTNIVTPLFELIQSPDIALKMHAVCLMRSLLSDRRSLSTHDDVSRVFWSCIDDRMIEQVIQMVIHLSKIEEAMHPLLLGLLDLMDTILQDQVHCDIALKYLSADSLELLLTLVEPKKLKFDYKDSSYWEDPSLVTASQTQLANNLSRMDENSICFEQEIESCSRGLETTIRLATALMMARLGHSYSTSNEDCIHILKSRICTAVNNFVSHFLSDGCSVPTGIPSRDTIKRSFRLQVAVANSENEDFVAAALLANQHLNQKQFSQISNAMERTRSELRSAENRLRDLEDQNMRLMNQYRSQSILFNREISRIKENTSQDAKQLMIIHATERARADNRVVVCVRRMEETESELKNARLEVEEAQRTVLLTREELRVALEKTADLENEKRILAQQVDEKDATAKELQKEIQSHIQKVASLFHTQQNLEDELRERNQAVKDCEMTNETLRDNLEELFADMVSLTRIYEAKEVEASHCHRHHFDEIEAAGRKLRREEERNRELAGALDQQRHENEKLCRKLAKYKECLEDERRQRQDEASRRKRNGPVSYINQLHETATSDPSVRDRPPSRKYSESNGSRFESDKENRYSVAYGSQRWSHN